MVFLALGQLVHDCPEENPLQLPIVSRATDSYAGGPGFNPDFWVVWDNHKTVAHPKSGPYLSGI